MKKKQIKFAVLGDCHYSLNGNYSTRNCSGAKKQLEHILERLNKEKLDFVLSLGDLGDGHNLDEVLAVKETLKTCKHPVKFVIGNHDLVLRSDKEFSEVVGIPYKAYDFCIENYRFIVLNAFENSIYSRDKEKEQAYRDYVDGQNGRLFQRWPGIMNAETYNWLEKTLEDAKNQNQEVIMFSHVPVWSDACLRDSDENEPLARIADHIELLDLMDNYKKHPLVYCRALS